MPTATEIALMLTPIVTVGGTLGAVYLTQRGDRERTRQQLDHDRVMRQEERQAAATVEQQQRKVQAVQTMAAAAAAAGRAGREAMNGGLRASWERLLLESLGELSASSALLGHSKATEDVAALLEVADMALAMSDEQTFDQLVDASRTLQLTLNRITV